MNMLKKNYRLICVLILAASLVPYILISFYSRPCSDDYNFSIEMIRMVERGENGLFSVIRTAWETNMRFYRSWNGLYMSGFLQSLQPGAYLGEQNYFTGTLTIMLTMLLCQYYFIRTLFDVFEIDLKPLLPTCILFAFFIHGMISPIQGLYWFCGACDYIPFLHLLMVDAALILNYYYKDGQETRYIVLSSLVSLIIGGGNHITSFLHIVILLIFSIASLIRKQKRAVLIPLVFAILGFLLVVFAPGTRARIAVNESQDLIVTLIATIDKAFRLVVTGDYTLNLRFFVYLVLLTFLASFLRNSQRIKVLKIHPVILFLLFAMFFCEMLAVPYFAMGTFGAGRIKNIDWMAFTVLIGLLWVYTLVWLADRHPSIEQLLGRINSIDKSSLVIVCCVLLVAFSRNMYAVTKELTDGTAQVFADQYDQRYELMKQYRGSEEIIELDPIIDSVILKFDDISPDLEDWRNVSWNQYYKVKAILKSDK